MRSLRTCVLAIALLGSAALPVSNAQEKEKPNLPKEVQLIIDRTNEARAKDKLPPLKANEVLTKAAVSYSAIMSKDGKKAQELMNKKDLAVHEMGGKNPAQRLDDFGYEWIECAENVACALRPEDFKIIFERWMKSKYHHDNIMNKKYEEVGIGIYKHPDRNEWYITQLFGTQRKD